MFTSTLAGELDRMVSLSRPSYMINAVRRSDGTLRIPTRSVDGQRVNTYVLNTQPVSLGSAAPPVVPGGVKGKTNGGEPEAVKSETAKSVEV